MRIIDKGKNCYGILRKCNEDMLDYGFLVQSNRQINVINCLSVRVGCFDEKLESKGYFVDRRFMKQGKPKDSLIEGSSKRYGVIDFKEQSITDSTPKFNFKGTFPLGGFNFIRLSYSSDY